MRWIYNSVIGLALQRPMADRVPQPARYSLLLLITNLHFLSAILRQPDPFPRLDQLVGKATQLGAGPNGRGAHAGHSSEENLSLDSDRLVKDTVKTWIERLESSVVLLAAGRERKTLAKLLGKLESLLLFGESGEA